MASTMGNEAKTLGDYTRIAVETDEDDPVAIATITADGIDVADGYRVRLTPEYNQHSGPKGQEMMK